MACEHDLAEMDTAAHWDGICPLCMNAEVEKLRAAIAWALGEQPDAEGRWFGEAYDEDRARYGWRKHLRKLAGLPTYTDDKASRTILRSLV
jgi:hypothetical protein